MEYLIINHTVEVEGPAPGTPEFGAMMGQWVAYNQMLIDNGHWIDGGSLTPTAAATSVAKSGNDVQVTDGPFAETKEQIAGYYVIKAADLDQAIELAQAMPADDVVFEIRPIAYRPDA